MDGLIQDLVYPKLKSSFVYLGRAKNILVLKWDPPSYSSAFLISSLSSFFPSTFLVD